MKNLTTLILLLAFQCNFYSQDTYSIVAVDTVTGEVGSAGASCIDLTGFGLTADFLGDLIPGKAAINTQSYYLSQNQANARRQALQGKNAREIIEYLADNDFESNPGVRQYGIVTFHQQIPVSAAFTGLDCLDWKGHHTGADYSIQGNILKGPEIIDSMQARYLRTKGSLVDKLMAAMQGANVIGADSRCEIEGTSALFAFLKVSKKDDKDRVPSIKFNVILKSGSKKEPLDSLQSLVNIWKKTTAVYSTENNSEVIVFPNPCYDHLIILNEENEFEEISIYNTFGKLLKPNIPLKNFNSKNIPVMDLLSGVYLLKIESFKGVKYKWIIKK